MSSQSHTDNTLPYSAIDSDCSTPIVHHTRKALWQQLTLWRRAGLRTALVPTMGNLHDGHLSLVRLASKHADRVIVSIFVNPTQFGPTEDFSRYPRTLSADLKHLQPLNAAPVNVGEESNEAMDTGSVHVFAPSADQIYPHGLNDPMLLNAPKALSETLCGLSRPGHFDGVVSVVSRLLNLVQPDCAVFGEKDFQQLLIIEYLCREMGYPLQIIRGATLREADGLAMSSRNQYLDPDQRRHAAAIHAQLQRCVDQLNNRPDDPDHHRALESAAMDKLTAAGLKPEYFAIRRADNLQILAPGERADLRVLAAARLGQTRLIDNVPGPTVANHE